MSGESERERGRETKREKRDLANTDRIYYYYILEILLKTKEYLRNHFISISILSTDIFLIKLLKSRIRLCKVYHRVLIDNNFDDSFFLLIELTIIFNKPNEKSFINLSQN